MAKSKYYYWVAIYYDGEKIQDRIDLCKDCLTKYENEYGENNVVPYDGEWDAFCDDCGDK